MNFRSRYFQTTKQFDLYFLLLTFMVVINKEQRNIQILLNWFEISLIRNSF